MFVLGLGHGLTAKIFGLGLSLEAQVLGLGLAARGLDLPIQGLGLGLDLGGLALQCMALASYFVALLTSVHTVFDGVFVVSRCLTDFC